MKFIKKCPVFILLISTGLLLTIIAIGGKNNIYKGQDYNPFKAPILSVMFTALNDDVYPWQMFTGESVEVSSVDMPEADDSNSDGDVAMPVESASPDPTVKPTPTPERPTPTATPEPTPDPALFERIEPLRESTYDEYISHISADIYGDAGVLRAALCEFATVDESYFDDALFIGDSRTVGLRDYTDLSEHADFYCETSLTIYKVMDENFKGKGTISEALSNKDYGKIYIMVGINELGRGTTEDFMSKYTEVIDTIHELKPDAKIFIQGIMRVSGEKNRSDAIFNNSNINARNNAIATLADNQQIFYIDVNEVICDEEGDLMADYTFDKIHLLGAYNDIWKQFLLAHGAQ